MAEKVNQGPSGAPNRRVGSPGQSSDGGDKDQLVSQSPMQHDPYKARGSDFPVSAVAAGNKQSGLSHGTAEGADQLAAQSVNQCGPRHVEDSGPGAKGSGTPTEWAGGGRSAKIASAFPIQQSKGEASDEGGQIGVAEYVDLATGMVGAKGYSQTKVKETPQASVSIPSR